MYQVSPVWGVVVSSGKILQAVFDITPFFFFPSQMFSLSPPLLSALLSFESIIFVLLHLCGNVYVFMSAASFSSPADAERHACHLSLPLPFSHALIMCIFFKSCDVISHFCTSNFILLSFFVASSRYVPFPGIELPSMIRMLVSIYISLDCFFPSCMEWQWVTEGFHLASG